MSVPQAIIGIVKKKKNLEKNKYKLDFQLKEFFISPRYFPIVSPKLNKKINIKLDHTESKLNFFLIAKSGNNINVMTNVININIGYGNIDFAV